VKKKGFANRREHYTHAAKVVGAAAVLLPVYAGLLTTALVVRTVLIVLGIEMAHPDQNVKDMG